MPQLTKSGFRFAAERSDMEPLRAEFQQFHTIKIKNFLSPELLELVVTTVGNAKFRDKSHDDIAKELMMVEEPGLHGLWLLMNDPKLFSFIQTLSGCEPVHCFLGRVYRMDPKSDHFDQWHQDIDGQRMVGISINLSTEAYDGGTFEIRPATGSETLRTMPNLGLGDAIFFRIREDLCHRITPMQGQHMKTAFAGWFQNGPDFIAELKKTQSYAG